MTEIMRKRLNKKGWTQRDLAWFAGLTEATISRYLSGERTPRLCNAMRVAAALDITLEELSEALPGGQS